MMALHWLVLRLSAECGYPKWLAFFMLPQNFFIFILFYDFYRKAYNKKPEVIGSGTKTDLNSNDEVLDNPKFEASVKTTGNGSGSYNKNLVD